ncbi:protein kish-A-like [Erinaceus europaeus]|uniref:Protein kish n=1 Tax=Erinaceus europaeus TaxID=9365 RepID=A0ABM3XGD5_ERIEU|nr:protein kish-A-like [Erinaceus europaeus]
MRCDWAFPGLTVSVIFNFQSLLTIILLLICTSAYIQSLAPSHLEEIKLDFYVHFESVPELINKSPYEAVFCVVMAVSIHFMQ